VHDDDDDDDGDDDDDDVGMQGMEAAYRNKAEDVIRFFEKYHANHHKVHQLLNAIIINHHHHHHHRIVIIIIIILPSQVYNLCSERDYASPDFFNHSWARYFSIVIIIIIVIIITATGMLSRTTTLLQFPSC